MFGRDEGKELIRVMRRLGPVRPGEGPILEPEVVEQWTWIIAKLLSRKEQGGTKVQGRKHTLYLTLRKAYLTPAGTREDHDLRVVATT
jgi:hypothetical protein